MRAHIPVQGAGHSNAFRPVSISPRTLMPRRGRVRAQADASSTNACRTCGMDLSKAPGGCDQEGRIVGGLGAVPGFGWWPIKAYRPCPGLSQAGLDYVRKGQGTNEVLFGGTSLGSSQQAAMQRMKQVADKGLDVEVEARADK